MWDGEKKSLMHMSNDRRRQDSELFFVRTHVCDIDGELLGDFSGPGKNSASVLSVGWPS